MTILTMACIVVSVYPLWSQLFLNFVGEHNLEP
jgi:hypothetical protein